LPRGPLARSGATFWYWLGRKLGKSRVKRRAARHGRWLTMCPPDVDRADAWFARHGGAAVLLGRIVPAMRSVISLPAGINRTSLPKFMALSAIGTTIWTTLLVLAGYLLEASYETVSARLNPLSKAVFALLAGWHIFRVVKFRDRCVSRRRRCGSDARRQRPGASTTTVGARARSIVAGTRYPDAGFTRQSFEEMRR